MYSSPLFLEQPLNKSETKAEESDVEEVIEGIVEEAIEEVTGFPWQPILTATAGLVLALWLFRAFHRWQYRRYRRRKLQARIQRMKRRMDK